MAVVDINLLNLTHTVHSSSSKSCLHIYIYIYIERERERELFYLKSKSKNAEKYQETIEVNTSALQFLSM